MIIMIIFLFLTIVMILCTAYYLDYKKKSLNKPKNSKTTTLEQKETSKNNSKKKLSDILEIKIKDNIINLGNRYSVILKLGNIDYNMLSNSEQNAVEDVLMQSALAIDYPIQFFTTTEYIDTTKVVSLLKQNKSKNPKITEYKNYLIEYLNNLMENRTISVVKNYAVISYDGFYDNAIE